MVDIFENPRGHNLGCTLGEPFKVSRSFRHGERFKWEEYDFEITHSPGHTEYQMALFVTIDGARVAFTGDAFFPHADPTQGVLRHNLIFRNHVESDSHLKSIRNLIDHEPNIIAPGHGRPFLVNHADLLATEQRFKRQEQLFHEVIADPDVNFGLDPSWCSIYPYQMLIKPGDAVRAEIRVKNYRKAPMKMEIALVAPGEWKIEPDVLRFEASAGEKAHRDFRIEVPRELAAWLASLRSGCGRHVRWKVSRANHRGCGRRWSLRLGLFTRACPSWVARTRSRSAISNL